MSMIRENQMFILFLFYLFYFFILFYFIIRHVCVSLVSCVYYAYNTYFVMCECYIYQYIQHLRNALTFTQCLNIFINRDPRGSRSICQ